jgi:Uma2 family endonuclease
MRHWAESGLSANPNNRRAFAAPWPTDRYEEVQLRGDDRIISPTFPELNLTAEQVLQAANQI